MLFTVDTANNKHTKRRDFCEAEITSFEVIFDDLLILHFGISFSLEANKKSTNNEGRQYFETICNNLHQHLDFQQEIVLFCYHRSERTDKIRDGLCTIGPEI